MISKTALANSPTSPALPYPIQSNLQPVSNPEEIKSPGAHGLTCTGFGWFGGSS